jgi:hypothetical protein
MGDYDELQKKSTGYLDFRTDASQNWIVRELPVAFRSRAGGKACFDDIVVD